MSVQIWLVWVEKGREVVRHRRADLGQAPLMREIDVPKAALWANHGNADDLLSAQRHAAKEGYDVVEFDPPREKSDALKAALSLHRKKV